MGVWKSENTVITDVGMKLFSEIAGKKELRLTRAVAGTDYTAPSELTAKTSINHVAMDLGFSEIGQDENRTTYVDVYLENSEVTEAFYHQQIGLYAKDMSDNDVLFLIAQADSPDYIPVKTAPVYITHRIFMKFSGNADVEVSVDFSGIVTQETLREELKKKENVFDKNSAFNKNFSNDDSVYMPLGKAGHAGGSASVARADHVHPIGTMLKFAENNWTGGGVTNLLPDTNRWIMSNGKTPDVWSGYAFEATFTGVWEGFSCFFDADMLAAVRGKIVKFGVGHLKGVSSRLELIVDGSVINYLVASETAVSAEAAIPVGATEITLRIIIFSADDLYCEFEGVYLYDKAEETGAHDDGQEIYLVLRKVRQEKLPAYGISGTLYITEQGNMYLASDEGTLKPLAGSAAIS